jgi:competence protein ComFC
MKILVQLFDTLFPPRTNQVLLRTTSEADIRRKYLLQLTENTFCLSRYQDSLIKALITENKYFGSVVARRYLATLLASWLCKQKTPMVLIPIPLSSKRQRERGYNQVTVVLEALQYEEAIRVDTTSLKRSRHTKAQTTLMREDRLRNLTSAFLCDEEKIQSYKHCTLVIVDDVLTTGATMLSAKAALAPHVHPTTTILCVALAH